MIILTSSDIKVSPDFSVLISLETPLCPSLRVPYFNLTSSAESKSVFSPIARSLVMCCPPIGITDTYCTSPSSKTIRFVVPDPISRSSVPASFCCLVITASADARDETE